MLVVAPTLAAAQEHEAQPGEEHAEHAHRNEAAFLLGATYEAEEGENLFTVGGEYSRRLTPRVSVSASFEHLTDVGAWVFVFPVGFRLYRGLTVSAAPGFEHISRRRGDHGEPEHGEPIHVEHGDGADGVNGANGANNLFLIRVGVGYAFEIGERYSILPGIAYDWINEEYGTAKAFVYGVKFGIGF